MPKLSERAMLASLRVGLWSGSLHDKEVTVEVSENHSADLRDAGRYSKQIVSRKFLSPVTSHYRKARQAHRILTLPWDDDGTRILSTMGYQHYTEQMRLSRLGFEAAVQQFVKGFPEYIKEAQTRLGTMFNRDDYPTRQEVAEKFYLDVEIKPVPEAGDFRAELSDASVKAIVKDIERRSNARVEAAMNDVFQRITDAVGKMAERLRAFEPGDGDPAKNVFRDSLVYNISELADLLPSLNITGDKRLDELQGQLKKQLVEHSPEILRTNEKVRKQTADKAEKLLKKVTSYLA